MRLLLRIGAALIAAAGVLALVSPSTLASAIGLPLDLDPQIVTWNIRVSALCLAILAGFMALAAAFFPERALRQSGALMILFVCGMALLLIFSPGPWVFGRIAFIALAALFTAFYIKALRARLRHR